MTTQPIPIGRRFRVEIARDYAADNVDGDVSTLRHQEVLFALGELRRAFAPAEEMTQQITEDYAHQLTEARKLKTELDQIQSAIAETKKEIATLHANALQASARSRVTDELDAIVADTEDATESILCAAESIDQDANDLIANLKKGQNVDLARDVQEQVIRIFEACNFQDLTGQRITKVVSTLRFIESRVDRMMEIWGGMDGFADVEPDGMPAPDGDRALLNGPALASDEGRASQDEIDALFD